MADQENYADAFKNYPRVHIKGDDFGHLRDVMGEFVNILSPETQMAILKDFRAKFPEYTQELEYEAIKMSDFENLNDILWNMTWNFLAETLDHACDTDEPS